MDWEGQDDAVNQRPKSRLPKGLSNLARQEINQRLYGGLFPLEHGIKRTGIFLLFATLRLIRICLGAAIGLFVFSILYSGNEGIGDIPLSQLTLSMIVGAVFKAILGLGALGICFWIAFGSSRSK